MNSDTIKDRGATDQLSGQARKPWVTPSLQIIALKGAEFGKNHGTRDGFGSGAVKSRS